ncbi:hypothetical protein AZE42_11522 [Rhizopogon vesiculosus]|uniref:Uncharacterized protein n=1 Tax=Rhizopogon vesiculosus TaxID=180088 RepID=A0A1J8R9N0_9AGAM|nr:hypothetical protein AZE42_11522 [Rhizopogon vesiculosus]
MSYDLTDRLLELVEDARTSWPMESGDVFDQEGPSRGMPHHAADLIYLFDNVPLLLSPSSSPTAFDDNESFPSFPSSRSTSAEFSFSSESSFRGWAQPVVDELMYARVRDAIQERWITFVQGFVQGDRPWDKSRDKVYVFGPEGEVRVSLRADGVGGYGASGYVACAEGCTGA